MEFTSKLFENVAVFNTAEHFRQGAADAQAKIAICGIVPQVVHLVMYEY